MIVCHCLVKTDRDIRKAAREGARSCQDVLTDSPAGSCCGGCAAAVEALLVQADLEHGRCRESAPGTVPGGAAA